MGKGQWSALGGAVLLIVLLLLVPRKPSGPEAVSPDPMDTRVAEAVAMVNGTEPMKGIMLLREVLQDDPENVEAHFQLGVFSVQSGQYDKALERFTKVTELAGDRIPDAWFYLGRTYATLDSIPQAVDALEHYMTLTQDTIILEGVAAYLRELQQ